jgi:hypothetical protein
MAGSFQRRGSSSTLDKSGMDACTLTLAQPPKRLARRAFSSKETIRTAARVTHNVHTLSPTPAPGPPVTQITVPFSCTCARRTIWIPGCFTECTAPRAGATLGATLSIVYSAECKASQKANRPAAMLPILVVLFVISYCLLTTLVFEQGKTIESQRTLIRAMLQDSTQLAALKSKLAQNQSQRAQGQASDPADQKTVSPNSGPIASAPQSSDKAAKQPGKPPRAMKQAPGKPESDLEDVRRSTRII